MTRLARLIIYISFISLLVAGVACPALAETRPSLVVDGKTLESDRITGVYLSDENRIMMTLADLHDHLNIDVHVEKSGLISMKWPGSNVCPPFEAIMTKDSNLLKWNDTQLEMDCTPVRREDNTYVPLAYVIIRSDIALRWIDQENVLYIFTKGQSEEEQRKIMGISDSAPAPSNTTGITSVPILMYHQVSTDPGPEGYNDLILDPGDFNRQLDYLQSKGYTTISMMQLHEAWKNNGQLPAKPVVLTFDDGYDDMYTNVYPELKKRNMTGTFFIVAGYMNTINCMTAEQVKELYDGGMEIGCHGYTHAELPGSNLEKELGQSRTALEKLLGGEVRFLCYPSGKFDESVKDGASRYGYYFAVTTQPGYASVSQNPYELKRVRISRGDGPSALAAKLGN